jgi:hypothetical protein
MRGFRKIITRALILGALAVALSGCIFGGASRADRLESSLKDAAMSVPGIKSVSVNANANTSGNFIVVKLVGDTDDKSELTEILRDAIPALLDSIKDLESGTFGVSIFSPDDSVSAEPGELGYSGSSSLVRYREFFSE